MSQEISITAVIPTIGNNDFLIDSINSIINQKKPFNEIIVFDNSQDNELKKSIPKSILQRVKWVSSKARLPCYESWNQAVNNASESHIFVMGDDDIALDNLSEICFDIAKEHDFALLKGFIIDKFSTPVSSSTSLIAAFLTCSFLLILPLGKSHFLFLYINKKLFVFMFLTNPPAASISLNMLKK
mgnify:CR=1 FL=1